MTYSLDTDEEVKQHLKESTVCNGYKTTTTKSERLSKKERMRKSVRPHLRNRTGDI